MDLSKTQPSSFGGGSMGFSNALNEFFYKSENEKPSWMMSVASDDTDIGCGDGEESLLDDAFSSYMSRTLSIDSSGTQPYSGTERLESSQESRFNDHEMETEVVLRVAMCCGKCEARVKSLTQLEGVSSVLCDRKTEKVTVTGNARPRDILEACKKFFKQAEMWRPDDILVDLYSAAPPP